MLEFKDDILNINNGYNYRNIYSMDFISNGSDYEPKYISEYFLNSLKNKIYNEILITGDKITCDLTKKLNNNSSLRDYEMIKFHSIFSLIDPNKKLIVPPRLCECFLDNFNFHYNNHYNRMGGDLLGRIRNSDVFINNYVNYATNYILVVDDIVVTKPIEDIYTQPAIDYRSQMRITTKYEIINPKVIFVLEDDYNDDWSYYKSQIREEKINKILNE